MISRVPVYPATTVAVIVTEMTAPSGQQCPTALDGADLGPVFPVIRIAPFACAPNTFPKTGHGVINQLPDVTAIRCQRPLHSRGSTRSVVALAAAFVIARLGDPLPYLAK